MKKSDITCDKCKGEGIIADRKKRFYEQRKIWYANHTKTCDKCKGDGFLDWVENVVGKKVSELKRHIYHGCCHSCETSQKICYECQWYKNDYNKPDLRTPKELWY